MAKEMMIFLVVMIICGMVKSNGEVYKVDWTSHPSTPYTSWVASHDFRVGDTIFFEYNKQFHDVVRVTHINFNACNATAPFAKWATGNDSFTIKKPGHYYFICSVPGHCQSGQRLDIRVDGLRNHTHVPTSSPVPSPPSTASPKSPPSPPTAQSPKSPPSPSIAQSPATGPASDSDLAPSPVPHHKKNGCSSILKNWVLVLVAIGFGIMI